MNSAKRQRVNNGIRNVNPMKRNTMNISDLNIDCLEEIFEWLSLNDLLSVADTSIRFRRVSGLVLNRKYGEHVSVHNANIQIGLLNYFDEADIKGIRSSLRFLRCFGHLISELDIRFDNTVQSHCNALFHYMNKYCAQNLIRFSILGSQQITIDMISKPFPNVKNIIISQCTLGRKLTNFNKWFPQMQHLELSDNIILDTKCIEKHFSHLKHFIYRNTWNTSLQRFNEQNLKKFIYSNGQLRNFRLSHANMELVRYMSQYLHQLYDLHIPPQAGSINVNANERIQFKGVKRFDIPQLFYRSFPLNSFEFDQLDELKATGVIFNDLRDFVRKHSTITNLTIKNKDANGTKFTVENMMEIAKALPSLSNLYVHHQTGLSFDEIIRFMAELKQLKDFAFTKNDTFEVSHLEKRLGNEWRVFMNFGIVTLQRNADVIEF